MIVKDVRPACGSTRCKKNGHTYNAHRTITAGRAGASLRLTPRTVAFRTSDARWQYKGQGAIKHELEVVKAGIAHKTTTIEPPDLVAHRIV
jgi:hypothetical protein